MQPDEWSIQRDLQHLDWLTPVQAPPSICTPYLTRGGVQWFLQHFGFGSQGDASNPATSVRILVDLLPSSVNKGSLDIGVLKELMRGGAEIRSLPRLHAKIYLLDDAVVLGSANLTWGGVRRNHEVVYHTRNQEQARKGRELFESNWTMAATLGQEDLDRCQREADLLPLELTDDGILAARWNAQYVLLHLQLTIFGELRNIELPPEVLGYQAKDVRQLRESVRMPLRGVGKDISERVRQDCKPQEDATRGLLQTMPGNDRHKVLCTAAWEEFEHLRKEWEAELSRSLETILAEEYEALREETWTKASGAVTAYRKTDGPSLEELLLNLKEWFATCIPSDRELAQDFHVDANIRGLHPLRFRREPNLRRALSLALEAPRQSRLFRGGAGNS